MTKYKWDLKDAREKRKELLKQFLYCENDDDRPNIYNSIMTYKEILKKRNILGYFFYSSSSSFINTSLGLEPFCGPIIPRSSSKSIILAALL